MNDLFKLLEQQMVRPKTQVSTSNFKNCLMFFKAGWKVKEYLSTQSQNVIVRLEKEEVIQDFILNLTEQNLWLKIIEKDKK